MQLTQIAFSCVSIELYSPVPVIELYSPHPVIKLYSPLPVIELYSPLPVIELYSPLPVHFLLNSLIQNVNFVLLFVMVYLTRNFI